MDVQNENQNQTTAGESETKTDGKIKTRSGSGYLRQLYTTARSTTNSTHSAFKNLTTFLVNFVPLDKIDASELQVRTHFDDEEVTALAHSIKEHGVLQPILVVPNGDRYKVIAGERRLRASKLAGLERIPARVINSDDKGVHEIALRENLDRVDLHPIEEGEGYLSLLEAQAYTSHDAIAKAFVKPKSRITECIGFTRLPEETKIVLMKRGLKQRAVLRKLLVSPPEKHAEFIQKYLDLEAQGEINLGDLASGTSETEQTSNAEAAKKVREAKPYEYKVDSKGVVVPGFRWKVGEGRERLSEFMTAMQKLLEEVKTTHPE